MPEFFRDPPRPAREKPPQFEPIELGDLPMEQLSLPEKAAPFPCDEERAFLLEMRGKSREPAVRYAEWLEGRERYVEAKFLREYSTGSPEGKNWIAVKEAWRARLGGWWEAGECITHEYPMPVPWGFRIEYLPLASDPATQFMDAKVPLGLIVDQNLSVDLAKLEAIKLFVMSAGVTAAQLLSDRAPQQSSNQATTWALQKTVGRSVGGFGLDATPERLVWFAEQLMELTQKWGKDAETVIEGIGFLVRNGKVNGVESIESVIRIAHDLAPDVKGWALWHGSFYKRGPMSCSDFEELASDIKEARNRL